MNASKLYIVPTPIGNMQDITLRALDVLKTCDVIVCEDTRVTQKLLLHHTISTRLICYNDHSNQHNRQGIIDLLAQGADVALVSDAGTPLISDPGYKLVQDIIAAGYRVESLPGPSSVITALTLSGLPTNQFTFLGFLPSKPQGRQQMLLEFASYSTTLVFFESAKRLLSMLTDALEILGNRKASVLREMTKTYEETTHAPLAELIDFYAKHSCVKGEIVVVISGTSGQEYSDTKLEALLQNALKNMSVRQAADFVSQQTGLKRKQLYETALKLSGKK